MTGLHPNIITLSGDDASFKLITQTHENCTCLQEHIAKRAVFFSFTNNVSRNSHNMVYKTCFGPQLGVQNHGPTKMFVFNSAGRTTTKFNPCGKNVRQKNIMETLQLRKKVKLNLVPVVISCEKGLGHTVNKYAGESKVKFVHPARAIHCKINGIRRNFKT